MIRRINKLKHLGRFAELRASSGSQHDFARLNVIYARNASGKSTICDLLRSVGSGKLEYLLGRKRFGSASPIEVEILLHGVPATRVLNGPTTWRIEPTAPLPRVLVFDERFVTDNVLVGHAVSPEHRRNIYGLALGEHALALKEAVDATSTRLSEATTRLNAAENVLNAFLPAGFTRESFRALPPEEAVDQRLQEANEEAAAARRANQNAQAIHARRPLPPLVPARLPEGIATCLEGTLDGAALQAERQIREHLQQHAPSLNPSWTGQGFHAQQGTGCPYCGQDMSATALLAAYRSYFSGALQEMQNLQSRITRETDTRFGTAEQRRYEQILAAHRAEQAWWRDAADLAFDLPPGPSDSEIAAAMDGARSALAAVLARKQAQPSLTASFSEDESAALARWEEISAALLRYSEGIGSINQRIAARQAAAGTVDVRAAEQRILRLQAQKKRHEPATVDAFREFDAATENKRTVEREKTAANRALKEESEAVLQNYGQRINALLERFGVEFRIVSGGVSFPGGTPAGDLAIELLGQRINLSAENARNPALPSLANTLSCGDRSALALAFFIAQAEGDPRLSDTIVVFDDPFNSQDRSRRQRTIDCVGRIAAGCRQTFVLSHELDFAQAVAGVSELEARTFILESLGVTTTLAGASLPALPGLSYHQDHRKLTDFLAAPTADAGRLKDVARSIRQTLEAYLRIKYPDQWRENDWLGDMIGSIREAQAGSPLFAGKHLVTDLTDVNTWGKRYYHSEFDGSPAATVDPTELTTYVRQTLGIIAR